VGHAVSAKEDEDSYCARKPLEALTLWCRLLLILCSITAKRSVRLFVCLEMRENLFTLRCSQPCSSAHHALSLGRVRTCV
jgi:hypothetical protein